eukprot:TRINITY_DN3306_c0_g1_i2.p3 TRINITY_DN3306_c0_g1~~TRINITY_DN3306_c0_g1_i2.p3  ORF type:complete len:105 (-),score=20.33 TRINITY_DN3306_c0_g1_i2:93-407(-)
MANVGHKEQTQKDSHELSNLESKHQVHQDQSVVSATPDNGSKAGNEEEYVIFNIASHNKVNQGFVLSLIHISEPTRPLYISYAVFCLKKKKKTSNDKISPDKHA